MARPIKEGLDYFPHDTDAVNDEKLEILRSLYGNDGYAFFFILLERIYRAPDAELNISDAETIQVLAKKVSVTVEKFNEMLATALKWGCFDKDAYENGHILTSNGIKKRASVVLEKRKSMRNKYEPKQFQLPRDRELATISKLYEENIGALTPIIAEALKDIAIKYPPEWFEEAAKEACQANVRRLSYISSILERWQTEGFKASKPGGKGKFQKGELPTTKDLEKEWKV